MLNFQWPPAGSITITGTATEAKQDSQITLQTSANTKLDTLHTDLGSVATSTKQDTGNTSLGSIDTKLNSQATAANQTAQSTLFGAVTETAPASDTASSGLNGRLQRIAQRLTSLIALFPTSLNQKTMTASFPVVIASDQSTLAVNAASLPLPTGAATSALQSTGNTSVASIDTKTPALGQALAAASVPVVLPAAQITALTPLATVASTQSGTWTVQPGNTANTTAWLVNQAGRTSVFCSRNDYTSVSITTSAYVQVIASTSATINRVSVFDSSGQTMVLAVGAALSEVDKFYIFPGGNGDVELQIPAGSRVSVKAVSANATVGELILNFFG